MPSLFQQSQLALAVAALTFGLPAWADASFSEASAPVAPLLVALPAAAVNLTATAAPANSPARSTSNDDSTTRKAGPSFAELEHGSPESPRAGTPSIPAALSIPEPGVAVTLLVGLLLVALNRRLKHRA